MHDLVIRHGTVVDGTGRERRTADVAVDDGVIAAIGSVAASGRREIDARNLLVTPGWVDVHTHYDGQVTWDPLLAPSSWNGVTTIVMGNCGVGFAPVRRGQENFLIELMEGVEDIPGTALHEGIDWRWESFPEYLDALATMPRVLDVAAQVPHCAIRAYVLGDRAHDLNLTDDEIVAMAQLTEEAVRAGAVGFSTSRTILHRSRHGLVPGTHSKAEELLALGRALGDAGHGVFEMVSDLQGQEPDLSWMVDFCRSTGRTLTFALAQSPIQPHAWRETLARIDELAAQGINIVPQVPCRPTGMLYGLQSSLHSFISHPTYRDELAALPLAERVARLRDPQIRARLLAEEPSVISPIARVLMSNWPQIYPLGDPPDYEPAAEKSVAAAAAREGRRPEEVMYDWLLERDGRQLLFAPLANYVDGNFDALREMILHPRTVLGLSDGGAHCGLICDASMPTYLLTHWARDRKRGARIDLEKVVHLQTGNTARVYGFTDRGSIEVGKKADLNVVDFDALQLHAPEMVFDLPASGRRLVQRVDGYRATVVSGEVTFEHGEPTGTRPGRLVRGGQPSR
ncbi:MAG TPA: amidohydrolase family protein [Candidatus Acidoferrales bacterium]|nr:amidohydrolase family protein [Candidatus Acidoferrales bacterium]